jgi:hypothetical protein
VLVTPWTTWPGSAVANALPVGTEPGSQTTFACRTQYLGGISIGFFYNGINCSIGSSASGAISDTFEVLTTVLTQNAWLPATNGTVPPGSFQAGRDGTGNPRYLCRATFQGATVAGQIIPGQGCQIQYGFNAGQYLQQTVAAYQVLVPTPPMLTGPFKIHTKSTGRVWSEGSNLLISTQSQPDDASVRYTLQSQPGGGYRILVQQDGKELHEDGVGDKLLSTRYQPNDDFTIFFFEQQGDIGSYRMRTKADNQYLAEGSDGLISARTQVDDDNARLILEPTTATLPTPAISFNPTSLSFGFTPVGTTTAAKSIQVQNTGSGTLTISNISITGDFAQTNNCASLSAQATCTINVTFSPTKDGFIQFNRIRA